MLKYVVEKSQTLVRLVKEKESASTCNMTILLKKLC